jgi:hypothetical protein
MPCLGYCNLGNRFLNIDPCKKIEEIPGRNDTAIKRDEKKNAKKN